MGGMVDLILARLVALEGLADNNNSNNNINNNNSNSNSNNNNTAKCTLPE